MMWSETVGLRTRPVWDQKIGLGLARLVMCCEIRSCHAHRQNVSGSFVTKSVRAGHICRCVQHCVLAAFCQLLLNEYCIVLYCISVSV